MSGGVVTEDSPTRLSLAWARRPVPSLLLLAVATRALLVLATVVAAGWLGTGTGWNRGPGFIPYFARWDSGYYMDIAEFGYGFKPEAWAFDPGYPLAVSLLWRVMPLVDLPTAGFLVSNAAFLATIPLFHRLSARWFDETVAWRATALLVVLPGAFYLSAVYADALFLLLLVGTLLALDRRRWLVAGALASCAAITRPPGLFLIGALGLAALVDAARARRFRWRPVAGVALSFALPVAFAAYSWRVTGDPNVSMHAREAFWPNVQWHAPWTIFRLDGVTPIMKVVSVAGVLAVLPAMVFAARELRHVERIPVAAYTLVLGTVYLCYAEPNPIIRYLVALPGLVWLLALATRGSRAAFVALAIALFAGQLLVAGVFASWGPLY